MIAQTPSTNQRGVAHGPEGEARLLKHALLHKVDELCVGQAQNLSENLVVVPAQHRGGPVWGSGSPNL
jgi:hypothetical protein